MKFLLLICACALVSNAAFAGASCKNGDHTSSASINDNSQPATSDEAKTEGSDKPAGN